MLAMMKAIGREVDGWETSSRYEISIVLFLLVIISGVRYQQHH